MIAGSLEIQLLANLARLQQDMNQAKGVLTSFERHAVAAIDTVKKAAAALGIGFGVHAFKEFIDSAIEAMAATHELSQRTGVTVETLSALQLVAKQSGTSMDDVAKITQKLSANLLQFARDGGGKAGDAFKTLGITQKQAGDALNDMSKFLPDFAKRLVDSSSGGRQVALAMELMGKSGGNALPFLYQLAETQKLTAKFTTEQAAAADEYKDSLDALRDHASKFGIALANDVLPMLNKITSAMLKAREEGEGFWGSMVRGLQTFLTGDDLHKANVQLVDLTDQLMKLEKAKAAGSGVVWDPVRGVLDDVRGESKTLDAEIARVKEQIAAVQRFRAQLEAEAAKPDKPKPPQPDITDENAVKMAQQIAAARAKVEADAQRDMLTKQQQALDLFHKLGLVSEEDFFAQRQIAIDQGMAANLAAIQKQIAAEAAVLGSDTAKDDAKRAARVKTIDLEGQLAKVRAQAASDTLKLWGDQYVAQQALIKKENDLVDQRIAKQVELAQTIMAMRRAFDDSAASTAIDTKYMLAEIDILKTQGLTAAEVTKRLQDLTIAKETELRIDQLRRQENERIRALTGEDLEIAKQAAAIIAETDRQIAAVPGMLRANIAAKGTLDAVNKFNEESKRIGNTLNDSITDGLLRGFDHGETFASNFLKQLKAQFQALVLRPVIQFALSPITGTVSAALAGLTTAGSAAASTGGASGGGLSLSSLSNLSNVGSFFQNIPSVGTALQNLSGAFNTFNTLVDGGTGALDAFKIAASGGQISGSLASLSPYITAALQLVTGNVKGAALSTAGAVLGSFLPIPGGSIIGATVANLLGGVFGGSKKIPAKLIDSGGLGFTGEGTQFFSRGSQGSMDVASAVSKGIQEAAKGLSITLPSYGVGFGSNTGNQGANPNFSISASVGTGTDYGNQRNVFASGEEMGQSNPLDQATIALRSAQAMLAVLREGDMPGYLRKFFDSLKPIASMSADDVNAAIQAAGQLKSAYDLLAKIADLSNLSASADQLIELFGDVQTAVPLLQSYYENFFSDAERQAQALKQVDDAMVQLGITTLPKTRAEFRALVEAQDLATDAGKAMFQSLIAIAPAFAAVTDAATDQTSVLQDLVSNWGDVAKTLRDYAAELAGGLTGGAASYASTRSAFAAVSMSARMGDIDAANKLKDAGEAFREASLATSRSSVDYIRDLATIKAGVSGTISTADQQVSIAQKQLDELRNITAALGGTPGHASGLAYVPHDNYLMRAHEGEAVLTASQAATWRGGRVSISASDLSSLVAQNAELLEEVKALRAEQRSGIMTVARNTKDTANMMDRVTQGGTSVRVTADSDAPLPVDQV